MQILLLADRFSREFPAALLINNFLLHTFHFRTIPVLTAFFFPFFLFFPLFLFNLKEHCPQSLLVHLSF